MKNIYNFKFNEHKWFRSWWCLTYFQIKSRLITRVNQYVGVKRNKNYSHNLILNSLNNNKDQKLWKDKQKLKISMNLYKELNIVQKNKVFQKHKAIKCLCLLFSNFIKDRDNNIKITIVKFVKKITLLLIKL